MHRGRLKARLRPTPGLNTDRTTASGINSAMTYANVAARSAVGIRLAVRVDSSLEEPASRSDVASPRDEHIDYRQTTHILELRRAFRFVVLSWDT